MEKRGYGHIEIVISFVLFVSVVIAVFYIIDPFSAIREKSTNLEYIKFGIEEKTKVDVYSISINALQTDKTVYRTQLNNEVTGLTSIVKKIDGTTVNSHLNGVNLLFENGGEGIYYAIISPDLNQIEDNLGGPQVGAEIISIKSRKVISERELVELANDVDIRQKVSVPEGIDFNFKLERKDIGFDAIPIVQYPVTGIDTSSVPEGIEVYSKTYRVEVINQNGEIYFGDLTIATW